MIFTQETIEQITSRDFTVKLRAGGYYRDVRVKIVRDRIQFYFAFNRDLLNVVKSQFEKRRWNPDEKFWDAPLTFRNIFRLQALQRDKSPYALWENKGDKTVVESAYGDITPYKHQIEITNLIYHSRWTIVAAEMGTGKTLAAIIAMKMSGVKEEEMLWVGPKACLSAVRLEFKRWNIPFRPTFITYESLRKLIRDWPSGKPAPRFLVLDESSKCKTPTTKRTQAAAYIAQSMREEYDTGCWITLLSGSPAPKAPTDWWSQGEIACPGFIAEGSIQAFRERLAIMEHRESSPGMGGYMHLKAWKDGTVCAECGGVGCACFDPVNEVEKLGKRLHGMVGVWFKRDCLDLPEKRYETRNCKPTPEILNIAKVMVKTTTRAVDLLTNLRTLSDGFEYKDIKTKEMVECAGCHGTGVQYNPAIDDTENCYTCEGKKTVPKIVRQAVHIGSPKDALLRTDLQLHDEHGRLNIYGAFQGTIDRIVEICHGQGWDTLKVDGRGWDARTCDNVKIEGTNEELLEIYQDGQLRYPLMAFVGQPGAAGMGLTLTASPTTIFYSNTYTPEHRLQAEDRGHRIGMMERGGLIVDYIHLPTDVKILEVLKRNQEIQTISLEAIQELFDAVK